MAAAAKKGFSNPAFKALGIPTIKLPSRNWIIFWSVLSMGLSGLAYDKYEQKQILKKYTGLVKPLAQEALPVDKKPRKITVFIAPPPNDYLETSLKIWRRFIKPVLYYSGLDYEVVEADRQGIIRMKVASQLRQLRLQMRGEERHPDSVKDNSKTNTSEPAQPNVEIEETPVKPIAKSDFLGVFYNRPKEIKVVDEDSLVEDPRLAGGVICIGRGAYKEYITGLHEGLLGPLQEPERVEAITDKDTASLSSDGNSIKDDPVAEQQNVDSTVTVVKEDKKKEEEEKQTSEEETPEIKIVKPYIDPSEYPNVEIPSELYQLASPDGVIRDPKTNVPILLYQPILMVAIPSLSGFSNIPRRIYRFYQKRHFAEKVCSETYDVVKQEHIRPFEAPADLSQGEFDEEVDWPKSWVKQGLVRKSEWTRELKCDSRIVEHMSMYGSKPEDRTEP